MAAGLLAGVVVEFSTWGICVRHPCGRPVGADPSGRHHLEAGVRSRAFGRRAGALCKPGDLAPMGPRAAVRGPPKRASRCCHARIDASFPSDHATTALLIAFGVYFVSRRAGWLLLVMHRRGFSVSGDGGNALPSGTMGSLVVSVASGYFAARITMGARAGRSNETPCSRAAEPLLAQGVTSAAVSPVSRSFSPDFWQVRLSAWSAPSVLDRLSRLSGRTCWTRWNFRFVATWIVVAVVAGSCEASTHRFWRIRDRRGEFRWPRRLLVPACPYFLASGVEAVEALTIVLAVGLTRGSAVGDGRSAGGERCAGGSGTHAGPGV